jgi:tetratricopeptide (TPR) repeat protein
MCLIPPPDLADAFSRDRFRCFHREIDAQRPPLLASTLWRYERDVLVQIQGQLLHQNGRPLLHLNHYLTDKRLGRAYTEQILLQIARALAALHQLKADNGDSLFHGFLLPRCIFVDFDANRTLNSVVIADSGLAYSFGSKSIYDRLKRLREGSLPIEKFCANELLEQLPMLAPEQKDPERLTRVSQASDFFTFGAIAVTLFMQQRFVSTDKVDWSLVPKEWHPFIKGCLQDDHCLRPKDFLELEDWLNHPELALTHRLGDAIDDSNNDASSSSLGINDLKNLLQQVQEKRVPQHSSITLTKKQEHKFQQAFDAGAKAIKMGRWKVARDQFVEAVAAYPSHAEANVSLAIAYYELGELQKAERYHECAKKIDPKIAKKFHAHIAFRI